jgi:RNA-directed DNA polymerase
MPAMRIALAKRLLVKEVLVAPDSLTIRHSIPIPQTGPASNGPQLTGSHSSGASQNLVIFCFRGVASPLLANVYLHYVFDLWVQAWRQKRAHGDVIVVRFADDIVVGFNSKADADQFRAELTERMRKFNLELHPEKTRLLEFGPFAIDQRQWRGEGKPETFNFLGFTHICVKKRSNGRFTVLRQTIRKRLQTKLNEVKAELQRRMHEPIPEVGKWLQAVVRGHIRYYGVPQNHNALWIFRFQVGRLWHRALSRRSHKGRVLWDRMRRPITRWLPLPSVCHPHPLRRIGVFT